jgi:hypothetical protein
MKFASALIPYTDAEREADAAMLKAVHERRQARRKSVHSLKAYEIPPSDQSKALDKRRLGESDDA